MNVGGGEGGEVGTGAPDVVQDVKVGYVWP